MTWETQELFTVFRPVNDFGTSKDVFRSLQKAIMTFRVASCFFEHSSCCCCVMETSSKATACAFKVIDGLRSEVDISISTERAGRPR